jgi:ABC-type lipoprotein release transport system permease subunit
MSIIRLALRNLIRNRRQSALTVAIVALGTWAIIVMWGFTEGTTDTMIRAQVSMDTGSVQIHRDGYLEDPNLDLMFTSEEADTLSSLASQQQGVAGVSVRLITEGLMKTSYGSQGVIVRAIDAQGERQVTELEQTLVDGRYLENTGEIMVGQSLAEKLDVLLGERVVVEAQGVKRARSKGYTVVGILSIGLAAMDNNMVFIGMEDGLVLTDAAGPTEIVLAAQPGADSDTIKSELQNKVDASFEVSTFYDLNPLVGMIVQIGQIRMIPLMFVLAALAGFGVANTMTFTVYQRIREMGVMLALGLKPKQLSRLVTVESIFTGIVGFAIGAMIGFALNYYLQTEGINMKFYSEAFPDMGVPHVLYSKIAWWHGLYGFIVVMLTAVVSARYPARRAANLEPTEAMRYV